MTDEPARSIALVNQSIAAASPSVARDDGENLSKADASDFGSKNATGLPCEAKMMQQANCVVSDENDTCLNTPSASKPPRRIWYRRKRARHQEILDAAKVLFKEKGYDICTMNDIADAAGITKGTIYLYFRNKEELYCWVVTGAAPGPYQL